LIDTFFLKSKLGDDDDLLQLLN